MSAFAIFILIVAAAAAILGFNKGMLAQIGSILAFVGGVMACRIFGPAVAGLFSTSEEPGATGIAIAYAAVFIVAYIAIILLFRLLRGAVHAVRLGILDRLAGAAFKTFIWMFMLSIALNIFATLNPKGTLTDTSAHPRRAFILRLAPDICGYIIEHAPAKK